MSVEHRQIPITSPCPITLDRGGVEQGDRSLFCGHCVKDVHLLSKMSEQEARAFLREREGEDICVSYAIRPDGAIRFRPEPPKPALVPIDMLTRRVATKVAPQRQRFAQAASIGAAALLAACTAHTEPEPAPAKPSAPLVQRVEPVELSPPVVEPCDPIPTDNDRLDVHVAGGMKAMPPPEFVEEDIQVDGGMKAMPLEEPPPAPKAFAPPPPDSKPMHARGGLRAMPINDRATD